MIYVWKLRLWYFLPLTSPQANTRASAILIDELDAA
jgi:hypothetical protein